MHASLPESARCRNCGYSLHGLAEHRCPECGLQFDPEDPTTYAGREYIARIYDMARPPSRALLVIAALSMPLEFVASFATRPEHAQIAAPLFLAITSALLWIDTKLRHKARGMLASRPAGVSEATLARWREGRHRTRWTWLCLVVTGSLALASPDALLGIQFALSRPFFAREVEGVRKQFGPAACGFVGYDRRVGVVHVNSLRVSPTGEFRFWLDLNGRFPQFIEYSDRGYVFLGFIRYHWRIAPAY